MIKPGVNASVTKDELTIGSVEDTAVEAVESLFKQAEERVRVWGSLGEGSGEWMKKLEREEQKKS